MLLIKDEAGLKHNSDSTGQKLFILQLTSIGLLVVSGQIVRSWWKYYFYLVSHAVVVAVFGAVSPMVYINGLVSSIICWVVCNVIIQGYIIVTKFHSP